MSLKAAMFPFLARSLRAVGSAVTWPFRAMMSQDDPFDQLGDRFQQQEIWNEEYRIWHKNGPPYLQRAKERPCPGCGKSEPEPLWRSQDGYDYVRCRPCGLVYVTPFLSYDDWRDYFEKHAKETDWINEQVVTSRFEPEYFNTDKLRFASYLRTLQSLQPRGRVLDVGCLTGSFLALARDHGYDVTGVEHRARAVELMREKVGITARQGFFEEVADAMYREGKRYEIVTMWETLEHVLFPRTTLEWAHRLLEPGGIVAISVPNFDNPQVKILREHCFHLLGGPGNAGHINMFTAKTLGRMYEEVGFEVLRMETEGASSYVDILAWMCDRYDVINSYQNAVTPPSGRPSGTARNYSAKAVRLALACSPAFKVLENAFDKGPILLGIARKKRV
jgi:2-polyprenyl-3-methyl-5-hydroxy-6-metoxy-1,4-benzoquinol methylase